MIDESYPTPADDDVRGLLADLALGAALEIPGIISSHDGGDGRYVTRTGHGQLPGVVVKRQGPGMHLIDLYLIAAMVSVDGQEDRVRTAVVEAVGQAGMAASLGAVSVRFISNDR